MSMRFRSLAATMMVTFTLAVTVTAVPPAAAGRQATNDAASAGLRLNPVPQLHLNDDGEPILPPGTDQPFSLRATSPRSANRYATTVRGLGAIAVITAGSTTAQKQAATFIARRGLPSSECYSFESSTSAGQYLRHSRFRIRLNANDGSALFAADATFCAVTGHTPQGLSWQSFNYPTRYLRHYNNQLWIASNGGRLPSDNPTTWAADTTWFTAAPWAS